MDQTMRIIEAKAMDAYGDGMTWAAFWERHAEQIRDAQPWNWQRLRRLVDRLLHLLTNHPVIQ